MILETTSNPFWVTTLYSNMRRREQEAATNPEDAKLCAQSQKSYIHRCMAIGLIFNGTGETEKQPPTFHALDDLYEYCYTQGKKPAYMSKFTLDELQEMFDTFKEELQNRTDPIGAFIHSQALKLGYLQENNGIDADDPFRSHFHQNAGQQRDVAGARQNDRQNRNVAAAASGGRRRRANVCMCDDCEVAMAISYCGDCSPPLRLCDNCWMALHRGATRRNHQRRDLSEAPRQTSYVPQAYRAPFAMLVAFHRASQERPQKLSLTAEEIKTRGQLFTDTDLEEAKQRGKPFSGFDSLENALIKNDIVLKEAARIPKYSLQQFGQGLALKCSNFDYAVQTLLQGAAVPTVPAPVRRPVLNNRQVCLLVDTEEPQKDRFVKVAQERGLSVKVRKLPTGDFCWILLPPGAQVHNTADLPDEELILPYLVERKTWTDLWTSVRSPRFENQVQRMKSCGIKNLLYLVEGSPKDITGRPGPEVETFLQGKLDRLLLEDKFFVNRTPSWYKTIEWLCHLTNLATDYQHTDGEKNLMTYTEFTRKANHVTFNANRKTKPVNGIVWSADQFAENITSHHRNEGNIGRVLDQTPQLSESILVIQGLTAYNTNCHSLYKRNLADYLQVPGQTAEECVQIHLEDFTHQLVSINVFQYYTLYLEVFKGVRIYRTETQEETQEFLSRFGATQLDNKVVGIQANDGIINNFDDQPKQDMARKVETDVMFANDSQEEEYMLQQALQQSLAEEQQDATSGSTVGTHKEDGPSSSKLYAPAPNGTGSNNSHADQNNNNTSNTPNASHASTSNTAGVKQLTEEEDDLQNVLQFKLYDELQDKFQGESCRSEKSSRKEMEQREKHQCDNKHGSLADNDRRKANKKESNDDSDDDLQKALEESRLQFGMGQRASKMGDLSTGEHHKSKSDSDDGLKIALEESRLQFGMGQRTSKMGDLSTEEHHKSESDSDDELQKALEKSRLQFGMRQRASKKRDLSTEEHHNSKSDSDDDLQKVLEESRLQFGMKERPSKLGDNLGKHESAGDPRKEDRQESKSDSDDELQKALQESKLQYEMEQKISKRGNEMGSNGVAENTEDSNIVVDKHTLKCDSDYELQNALQESKLQYEMEQKGDKLLSTNYNKDKALNQPLDLSMNEMENEKIEGRNSSGNKNSQNDEDRALRQELDDSRKEMKSARMEGRKSSGNEYNQNDDEDRALRQVIDNSRKEMNSARTEGRRNSEKTKDQNDDEEKVLEFRSKEMDSEQPEGSKNNGNGRDQNDDFSNSTRKSANETFLINSQEDNTSDDFFHEFEVPDFVNQNLNTNNDLSHQDQVTSSTPKSSNSIIASSYSNNVSDGTTGVILSSSRSYFPTDNVEMRSTSVGDDSTDQVVLPDNKERSTNISPRSQEHFDDNTSAYSSMNNDAIYVDSQDNDSYDDDHDVITVSHSKPSDNKHQWSSIPRENHSQSSNHMDEAILIDSQDIEEIDNTNDYEIARQLQEELNKETNEQTNTSNSTHNLRENVNIQIDSYREEQQNKFRGSKTGKSPVRKDPGLAFRQKAEAIAKGKVSLLSSAKHQQSDFDNPGRRPEKRGFDGNVKEKTTTTNKYPSLSTTTKSPQSMTVRNSCNTTSFAFPKSHSTPKTQPESNFNSTSSASSPSKRPRKSCNSTSLVFPPSRSTPSHLESSFGHSQSSNSTDSSRNSSALVFPPSSPSPSVNVTRASTSSNFAEYFTFPTSSPCSSNSRTTSEDAVHGFVFPSSSSSASPRPPEHTQHSTIQDSKYTGESSKPCKGTSLPKCSDCGEVGHRKGTKRCPYYYTEEAQRKREEQARKRKEKRDEEDQEQQIKVDALVAEQAEMAERAEQLRIQIEQFNQQNNNLPKMVEDAMKCLKKKRRK